MSFYDYLSLSTPEQRTDKIGRLQVSEECSLAGELAELALFRQLFGDRILCVIDRLAEGDQAEISRIEYELNLAYNAKPDQWKLSPKSSSLSLQLRQASLAFGGLANLKDKRILDIGCGTTENDFCEGESAQFHPWFCRALHLLGATAVGIDRSSALKGEQFEHYIVDLTLPGALDIFPDSSFDAVNMTAFFDSNGFQDNLAHYSEQPERIAAMDFPVKMNVIRETLRMLKPDGKLLIFETGRLFDRYGKKLMGSKRGKAPRTSREIETQFFTRRKLKKSPAFPDEFAV